MEAEKIKKKLNGSILKGKKFKIETARPHKRPRNEEEAEAEAPADGKKKSKKRKSVDGVLDGYEVPADRKVKRGWTEPPNAKRERRRLEKQKAKDDKKEKPQPKSKYTERSECLFRTTVPPNRASGEGDDDKKAKKKKKSSEETVVHEFAKTVTHPSFLRSTGEDAALTTTFKEGKGWVDAAGTVKEVARQKVRKDDFRPGQVAGAKEKRPSKKSATQNKVESPEPSSESEDWTSSSGSSSDESSDSESEASSPSASSSDSSEEEASDQSEASKETAKSAKATSTSIDSTDDSDSEMASEAPQDADESIAKEVHPLEALFKRPAPVAAEDQPAPDTNPGFSFFGDEDIESEDERQTAEPQTPFTPFTKKDLQARGLRSAAPTPDTAMVNRRMNWAETDEAEDDEVSVDTPVLKPRGWEAPKEETEFAKWFWEHRGENNRAWKKRRRDAAKEQRQRENRKKGLKGKS